MSSIWIIFQDKFQILKSPLPIRNNQHKPYIALEETVLEDVTFPEQAAQELIIKDGTVTHIGGGQYNGFIQGSC